MSIFKNHGNTLFCPKFVSLRKTILALVYITILVSVPYFVFDVGITWLLQARITFLKPVTETDPVTIYFITPTKQKSTQKADVTRLSHTLRLVPHLHWIVVEDAPNKTSWVEDLLVECGVAYTHLNKSSDSKKISPNLRGFMQRNEALRWLRDHRRNRHMNAVVYFGDDDNTYSLKLFKEMHKIKKVAVWPVGLKYFGYETPIVKNGQVVGWNSWAQNVRKFSLDMAGFAFNLTVLFDYPNVWFKKCTPGFQETTFLNQFVSSIAELEPMAKNCTQVLVWHTKTKYFNYDKKSARLKGLTAEI